MSARPLPSPVSLQRLLRGPGVWQDPFFGATSYLLQDPQSVVPTDLSGNGVTHTNVGTVALSTGGPWSLKGLTFARNTASYAQRVELGTGIAAGTFDFLATADPWSVEGWFVVDSIGREQRLWMSAWRYTGSPLQSAVDNMLAWTSTNDMASHVGLDVTSGGKLRLRLSNRTNSPIALVTAGNVVAGQPFYARASRLANGQLRLDYNGEVVTSSATPLRPLSAPVPLFQIGGQAYCYASHDYQLVGKVLSLRVTQGVQRPVGYAPYRQLPFFVRRAVVAPPAAAAGQRVITTSGATWTVPAGVSSVSIVCVGMRAHISGSTLVQAKRGAMVGTGWPGGNAGTDSVSSTVSYYGGFGGGGGSNYVSDVYTTRGGGGGAGGYLAAGGEGGGVGGGAGAPAAGTGAGAGGAMAGNWSARSGDGGGASLLGVTPGGGTLYGGGRGGFGSREHYDSRTGESWGQTYGPPFQPEGGKSLAWANAIAVSAGQIITFVDAGDYGGGSIAARIMWGDDRAFPNNAGDV